ncbi:hypothetical protein ABZW51_31995, partial [Streptomyces cellulosae]
MTKLLLSLHVLAAIVAVGPVTVAASMFPPAARRAAPADGTDPGPRAAGTVELLHRICRVTAQHLHQRVVTARGDDGVVDGGQLREGV